MELNEFCEKVEEVKLKNPLWFDLESDLKATDAELYHVEEKLTNKLPKEYKDFIKNFGGGYFAFTTVYSVKENSDWNILVNNKDIRLISSHEFLAISDNYTGDYYGFKLNNGEYESKISFFDHETQQVKETKYKDIYEFLIDGGLRS